MKSKHPSIELAHLLDEAFRILFQENLGLNHAEEVFTNSLKLLQSNNTDKTWFIEHAKNEIVSGGEVISKADNRPEHFIDSDLICFIAHATRWNDFKQAVSLRKNTSEYKHKLPGSSDIADLVESSLADDWEARDFYQLFEG